MSANFSFPAKRSQLPLPSPWWRVLALAAATLALHYLVLQWISGHLRQTLPTTPAPNRLTQIDLRIAKPKTEVVAPLIHALVEKKPRKPAAKSTSKAATKLATHTPKPSIANSHAPVAEDANLVSDLAMTEEDGSADEGEPLPAAQAEKPDPPAPPVSVPASAPEESKASNIPVYPVKPAPPVQLKYAVRATRSGSPVSGNARFNWQHDGQHYQLHGETNLLIFTLANFESTGAIDAAGLAPVLYTEKKINRAATNTHFNRSKPDAAPHPTNGDTISFSASSAIFPRHPGAQDRISLLWQLSGIGRAAPEQMLAGRNLVLYVAGVRDAQIWQIAVLGMEELQLDGSSYRAWHLQRQPSPGSYEQKLDIWLAPERDWLPVRVLYTEVNGDILELSLNQIRDPQQVKQSTPTFRTAEP